MTSIPIQEIERLVEYKLQRYRTHREWPDIRQEAVIAAWKALERTEGKGWAHTTVICRAAAWAAASYLREPKSNSYRRGQPEWRPPEQAGVTEPADPCWSDLAEDLCHHVLPTLSPRYQELFRRHYFEGETQAALAREQGVTWGRIQQIMSCCRNAFRRELGLPERGAGSPGDEKRKQRQDRWRNKSKARRARVRSYSQAREQRNAAKKEKEHGAQAAQPKEEGRAALAGDAGAHPEAERSRPR